MAEAQVRLARGLFGLEFCVADGFDSRAADVRDLRGRWVRVVCADDERLILEDEGGQLYEVEAAASCTYSDCSDPDDPYGVLEVYRLQG